MCKNEPDFDYFGKGLDGYMQYMDTFDEAFNADAENDDENAEFDMENEETYFDEEDCKEEY